MSDSKHTQPDPTDSSRNGDGGLSLSATERLLLSPEADPAGDSGTEIQDSTGGPARPNQPARPTMAGLAAQIAAEHQGDDPKVVNLAYYRIKKSLKQEGFDLITDDQGKLTLVLRVGR